MVSEFLAPMPNMAGPKGLANAFISDLSSAHPFVPLPFLEHDFEVAAI